MYPNLNRGKRSAVIVFSGGVIYYAYSFFSSGGGSGEMGSVIMTGKVCKPDPQKCKEQKEREREVGKEGSGSRACEERSKFSNSLSSLPCKAAGTDWIGKTERESDLALGFEINNKNLKNPRRIINGVCMVYVGQLFFCLIQSSLDYVKEVDRW